MKTAAIVGCSLFLLQAQGQSRVAVAVGVVRPMKIIFLCVSDAMLFQLAG